MPSQVQWTFDRYYRNGKREPGTATKRPDHGTMAVPSQDRCSHKSEERRWGTEHTTKSTQEIQVRVQQQSWRQTKAWDGCTPWQCCYKHNTTTRVKTSVRYKRALHDMKNHLGYSTKNRQKTYAFTREKRLQLSLSCLQHRKTKWRKVDVKKRGPIRFHTHTSAAKAFILFRTSDIACHSQKHSGGWQNWRKGEVKKSAKEVQSTKRPSETSDKEEKMQQTTRLCDKQNENQCAGKTT